MATTSCRDVAIPIVVAAQAGTIAGTLCVPPGATTVQVLVPGNTYNRSYWQVDADPAAYSYVRRANRAGQATLAIDRLGTGASLHPESSAMTLSADATTVHEVVAAVRAGRFGRFDRVVGVGHSLGSVVVNQLAGEHPQDLDALVLTGFSHSINAVNATVLAAASYVLPAGDPQFAGRHLDGYYLTTGRGGRTPLYAVPAAATQILAWDDRNRDAADLVELGGLGRFQIPNRSRAIAVPVLVVDGGQDSVACGLASGQCTDSAGLQASEAPWFGPRARVTAWLVPGVGHNVTLHRNAAEVDAGITDWIGRTVGSGAGVRDSVPDAVLASTEPASTAPEPVAAAADAVLGVVTPGLRDAYQAAVRPVPGLGNGTNPAPLYNDLLRAVGDGGPASSADVPVPPRF
jgi:pimeloyl-ACP methyl ester carboxylesterase